MVVEWRARRDGGSSVSAARSHDRITVREPDLVVQPLPEEVERFQRQRRGEIVTPVEQTTTDRASARRRWEIVVDGWRFEISTEPAQHAELRERALRAAAEHQVSGAVTLRAQIPGRVSRVWVSDGEAVEHGQRLIAIEAMKMENEVHATRAGTIRAIRVDVGTRVERDDELVTVE